MLAFLKLSLMKPTVDQMGKVRWTRCTCGVIDTRTKLPLCVVSTLQFGFRSGSHLQSFSLLHS